jgi:hypothetical protein
VVFEEFELATFSQHNIKTASHHQQQSSCELYCAVELYLNRWLIEKSLKIVMFSNILPHHHNTIAYHMSRDSNSMLLLLL